MKLTIRKFQERRLNSFCFNFFSVNDFQNVEQDLKITTQLSVIPRERLFRPGSCTSIVFIVEKRSGRRHGFGLYRERMIPFVREPRSHDIAR